MTTKPKTIPYKIVIEVLGKKWTEEGKNIMDALEKFDLTWENIKGKGTLTITHGKNRHQNLLTAVRLRRIFSSKTVKQMWASRFLYLLENAGENVRNSTN